ncbi:MAG TPA: ROK family protein [Baekduia sp.]
MTALYGGVETGGTWCVCAVGTGPDHIERREQFRTTDPTATLDRIVAFFAAGPLPSAIGIGSFGPVDLDPASPTWGHVTTTPKPGWRGAAVAPPIRERLGVPVAFGQDVATAALGEHRWGAGQRARALAYVTIGTGIGAGLLIDGRPWHGLLHPEAGHVRIPHDRARDPFDGACPSHGDCWEGLAGGPAIAARFNTPGDALPADHPFWALEAEYVALGLLALVGVFSPEKVILGGGVLDHPGLLDHTRAHLRDLAAGYWDTPLLGDRIADFLVPPALGDDAGVLGALALAADQALHH